jgi:hypothetical protein
MIITIVAVGDGVFVKVGVSVNVGGGIKVSVGVEVGEDVIVRVKVGSGEGVEVGDGLIMPVMRDEMQKIAKQSMIAMAMAARRMGCFLAVGGVVISFTIWAQRAVPLRLDVISNGLCRGGR